MSAVVPPTRRREAQPTVLELLQEFLLARNLRPGDRVPTEAELSTELGVSRNAIREALRALEVLGIVEIRHGQGMLLRQASLAGLTASLAFWGRLSVRDGVEALRPIAEVRDALETSLIGRVLGQHSEQNLHELVEAVAEMERLAAQGEHAPDADRRFHDVLYRPLDNWVLTYLLQGFWAAHAEVSAEADVPSLDPGIVARQHRALLDAVMQRDPKAAVQAMNWHFDNILRRPAPAEDDLAVARPCSPGEGEDA